MDITISYKSLLLEQPRYVDLVIDGILGSPEIVSNDLPFSTRSGLMSGEDRTRGRNFSIKGTVVGFSQTDFTEAINDLRIAFETAIPSEREMILEVPGLGDGRPVIINCRPRRVAASINADYDNFSCEFQADFFAVDSQFYSPPSVYELATLEGVSAPGGHGFPHGFPLGFGGGGTTAEVVVNSGTGYSWPVIIFFGPMVNPSIINQTASGDGLSFAIDIPYGDSLEVNTDTRQVLYSGGVNRYDTIVESDWFQLAPGNNTIVFRMESTTGVPIPGYATMRYRSAWL